MKPNNNQFLIVRHHLMALLFYVRCYAYAPSNALLPVPYVKDLPTLEPTAIRNMAQRAYCDLISYGAPEFVLHQAFSLLLLINPQADKQQLSGIYGLRGAVGEYFIQSPWSGNNHVCDSTVRLRLVETATAIASAHYLVQLHAQIIKLHSYIPLPAEALPFDSMTFQDIQSWSSSELVRINQEAIAVGMKFPQLAVLDSHYAHADRYFATYGYENE